MLLPADVLSLIFLSILAPTSFADIPLASAELVNVTIDDTFGDQLTGTQIVYDPQGQWKFGQNCTDCTARPDPSQIFDGTWHDGQYSAVTEVGGVSNEVLTAAVTFEGVAVYVFCIVTHSFKSPVGNSEMSFLLDGVLVGTFQQPPTGDTSYEYNVPVYVNESIPSGQHTIAIVNGQLNGNQSLTLLDYIVYTRDINSTAGSSSSLTSTSTGISASGTATAVMAASSSSSSKRTRTIIIAVVVSLGGILAIMAIVAFVIYFGRRRSRPSDPSSGSGVLATDAVPIDEEDPGTSGWVEGTWGEQGDPSQSSTSTSRRTPSGGKRKRGLSDALTSGSPVPNMPYNLPPVKGPNVPQSTIGGVQTLPIFPSRTPHLRAEPVSPSSSFGNLGRAPDSSTFLLPPNAPPVPTRPPRPDETDTFLDMGRSFQDRDTVLGSTSTHAAHPFATAQAVAPSAFSRQRSDSSSAAAPPSASSGALSAATRGYTHAHAQSNSHVHSQSPAHANSAAVRAPARQRSGSDLALSSAAQSPQVYSSALSSTATTPTSATALMPQRGPSSQAQARDQRQVKEKSSASSLSAQQPQARAPARRVDPIDPLMQPPRDGPRQTSQERKRERERGREREQQERERAAESEREQSRRQARGQQAQEQAQGQEQSQQRPRRTGSDRRQGMVVSERDRQRFGFLDVPQDADDGRPPSYRETG